MPTALSNITLGQLREGLERDGFVRIPHAFSEKDLERYRTAARGAAELARQGLWPYIRTVPKQFPPWSVEERHNGIWGVQHLMHPEMPRDYRQVFLESYFNGIMITAVSDLLQCGEEDLVMELYNMLITPEQDFALRWHRDDIPPWVSAEEELARLRKPLMHAQWNLSLYHDRSLVVIPGSHIRARTEIERSADPMEDNMPGQQIVDMEPGDIVFYNNNILHRGVYQSTVERMTLHGTIGLAGTDASRARNILQHGIGQWADKFDCADLQGDVRERAWAMQQRLILIGTGTDAGFSQDD